MALFQILSWQEIPSQIKAWDDFDEVKIDLGVRFTEKIDAAAQARGVSPEVRRQIFDIWRNVRAHHGGRP